MSPATGWRAWFIIAGVSVIGLSCRLSNTEYATIDAWLLCDECVRHEREAVRAIGRAAVHTLDQALVGPSPGRVANKVAQFRQLYRMAPSPVVSESTYVAALRSNYVALYQYRAAVSLGDIGGSRALAALQRAHDSAAVRNYRPDVARALDVILALAAERRPLFTGNISTTTPHFADTVHVVRRPGQAWTGHEQVTLHGSVFADSLVVQRWSQDSLAFLAVGPLGDYALSVSWLGPPPGRQVIPLRIIPPGYASHTPATALPVVVTANGPEQKRYLLLPSRPGDTTDFFRLEPTATIPVTAYVSTSGITPARLRWYSCSPLLLLATAGPLANAIGYVVDERGVPVAGATVTPVGNPVLAVTNAVGRFALSNIPASPTPTLRGTRIGFRPSSTPVQLVADSILLGIIRPTVSGASGLSRHASTITIPGGDCRLLQILVPSTSGPRTLRLRLTSP